MADKYGIIPDSYYRVYRVENIKNKHVSHDTALAFESVAKLAGSKPRQINGSSDFERSPIRVPPPIKRLKVSTISIEKILIKNKKLNRPTQPQPRIRL